jgi:tRNA U54 and U55 pseudouridine synthase Pus10
VLPRDSKENLSLKKSTYGTSSIMTKDSSPFLCSRCQAYLSGSKATTTSQQQEQTVKNDDVVCSCCMGLWSQSSSLTEESSSSSSLARAISKACEPYGGMDANRFATATNHTPTISIAADVHVRYKQFQKQQQQQTSSSLSSSCPVTVFVQDLKQHVQRVVHKLITVANEKTNPAPMVLQGQDCDDEQEEEEQGYLSLHILCLPPKDMQPNLPSSLAYGKKRKRQRNRPFTTQGGDPRVNLEVRLESQGYDWIPLSAADALQLSTNNTVDKTDNDNDNDDNNMLILSHDTSLEFHVAVVRRPIFIYGYYTKSRRDVSQTPFMVVNNNNNKINTSNDDNGEGDKDKDKNNGTKKEEERKNNEDAKDGAEDQTKKASASSNTILLGVTSVEEQICAPIVKMLGISTLNNNSIGSVIYGMFKFHASGREDMDVRMLLRPDNSDTSKGRPFCVQLIDALRPIETSEQLTALVHAINHNTTTTTKTETDITIDNNDDNNNKDNYSSPLWYGSNPLGVGLSEDFFLVPAKAFSTLQADTETKVKHYGCHCWSERALPPASSNNTNNNLNEILFADTKFPLMIQQKTPLRVLHRRANAIRERQILSANAIRIDDHHFRLELSTQAGTYVKEFVHGDLRRTKPSMATIMGCKTNILLLDCEGIELKNKSSSDDEPHDDDKDTAK